MPTDTETDEIVSHVWAFCETDTREWVPLAEVRGVLDAQGYTRTQQDVALLTMSVNGQAAVEPQPFGHRIGMEDRGAALSIANEQCHMISTDRAPVKFGSTQGGPGKWDLDRLLGDTQPPAAPAPTPTPTPTPAPTVTPRRKSVPGEAMILRKPAGQSTTKTTASKAAPATAKPAKPTPTPRAVTSPRKPKTGGTAAGTSNQGRPAMASIPPKLDIVGPEAEENAYKIAELLRGAFVETANYCESLANTTWPNLKRGLQDEGLDGGSKWSQLLHGGDAQRTAKQIVQPLYVVQTDLMNASRSIVVFGNRIRVNYFDTIRQARAAKQRSTTAIPVR